MRRPPARGARLRPATGKAPHFFKIIHSSVIEDRVLRIPRNFILKFLKEISDVALLNVAGGKVWAIKLMKEKEEIWFQKGFQEFMEYYSLSVGHLLVFRYDGNSHFNVLIFDVSATEIVYPCDSYDLKEPKCASESLIPTKEDSKPDVSAEFLDVTPCNKRRAPRKKLIHKCAEQNISKQGDPQFQRPHHSFRTAENKTDVTVDVGSRFHKQRDSCTVSDITNSNCNPILRSKKKQAKYVGKEREAVGEKKRRDEHKGNNTEATVYVGSRVYEPRDVYTVRSDRANSNPNPRPKSKVERVEDVGNARQLVDESKRSQIKHEENEEFTFVFEHPRDSNDLEEQNCLKGALMPTKEDSEDDDSVEILDVTQFKKQIAPRSNANNERAEKGTGKQYSPRLYKLRDSYAIRSDGANSKCGPLPRGKREQVKDVGKESQVVHKKRSQLKNKGYEGNSNTKEKKSTQTNDLEEQNCVQGSLTPTKQVNNEDDSAEIMDVAPFQKQIAHKTRVIDKSAEKGTSKQCGPQFQHLRCSLRIAGNRTKTTADAGSRIYELRNRSVVRSYSSNSKPKSLPKSKNEQVKDAGNTRQLIDRRKRSREKNTKLGLSESDCSSMVNCKSVHPCKKLRSLQELGLSVHYPGSISGLADASETDEVKQKANAEFDFNLEKEVEMDLHNADFSRNEPTMHVARFTPKRTSDDSPCPSNVKPNPNVVTPYICYEQNITELVDWKGANLAEQNLVKEFIFMKCSEVNSFLFHCPRSEDSVFASPKFTSCEYDNENKPLAKVMDNTHELPHSFCHTKLYSNNNKLPKTVAVESNCSKKGSLSQVSPIRRLNQTIRPEYADTMPIEIIEKARAVISAAAFTSENPFCTVTMRHSFVNNSFLMNMPFRFAKTHLCKGVQSVTLKVPGGRSWYVKCSNRETYAKLCKGWKAFVLDNRLEADDVCVFEVIEGGHNELKVSIFRST